jgi:hypothetical protein
MCFLFHERAQAGFQVEPMLLREEHGLERDAQTARQPQRFLTTGAPFPAQHILREAFRRPEDVHKKFGCSHANNYRTTSSHFQLYRKSFTFENQLF